MPAFEIRVSQLRGGDTLREGAVAPPSIAHHPSLPFGTRLLNPTSTGTRMLITTQPRTTRLV